MLQSLGAAENCIGEGGRCGAAVSAIHLHAKITIRPAGIVGGGEDDAANGLALTDQVGGGGSGENSGGGNDHPAEAVGCPHTQNHINGAPIAVATISSKHQGAALHTGKRAKHRFNKTF